MSPTRAPTGEGVDADEGWIPQAPSGSTTDQVTNAEFRNAITLLARAVTAQLAQQNVSQVDAIDKKRKRLSKRNDMREKGFNRQVLMREESSSSLKGSGGRKKSYPLCRRCGRKHKGECLAGVDACFRCGKSGHHAKKCRGKPLFVKAIGAMSKKEINPYPACGRCGKMHKGECLSGTDGCYKCGKSGHYAKDCRSGGMRPQGQGTQGGQAQGGGQQVNRFYASHGRQEVEDTTDEVAGTGAFPPPPRG